MADKDPNTEQNPYSPPNAPLDERTPLARKVDGIARKIATGAALSALPAVAALALPLDDSTKLKLHHLSSIGYSTTSFAAAMYIVGLRSSKEYAQYANIAPNFFGMPVESQIAGFAAIVRDLQTGNASLPAPNEQGEMDKPAVAQLMEAFARDPARVAVETKAHLKREEERKQTPAR